VNGTEVGYVSDIGENPHLVRISPDGKHAFVANYIGEIEENTTSSTLAIVDIDPNSESYLEVLTWLVNR
jgi:DNA-binding beta-propeller fold protein YncE